MSGRLSLLFRSTCLKNPFPSPPLPLFFLSLPLPPPFGFLSFWVCSSFVYCLCVSVCLCVLCVDHGVRWLTSGSCEYGEIILVRFSWVHLVAVWLDVLFVGILGVGKGSPQSRRPSNVNNKIKFLFVPPSISVFVLFCFVLFC